MDRPNATGTGLFTSRERECATERKRVNKAAYTPATPGFYGNVTRGSYTGPGVTNLDASLHKIFNMPYNEKHQLSIRFEPFNANKHPNWVAPKLNYSYSTFGEIYVRLTGSIRQLQLAAKYEF